MIGSDNIQTVDKDGAFKPAGDHIIVRVKRALAAYKKGTPEYYNNEAKHIDDTIRENRRYIFYHKAGLEHTVDYWLITRRDDVEALYGALEELIRNTKGDPRKLNVVSAFPGVIQENLMPSDNIRRIVMYASLGFVLQSRTALPMMPSLLALRYLRAIVATRMARDRRSSGGLSYDEKQMSILRNRVYFCALCTLKLFTRNIWTFFMPTSSHGIDQDIIPEEAPAWFKDLLRGIERGDETLSMDDVVQVSAEALTAKYEAEIHVYKQAMEKQGAELSRLREQLKVLGELQSALSKEASDVASVVSQCSTELLSSAQEIAQSEERIITAHESYIRTGRVPVAPPIDIASVKNIAAVSKRIQSANKEVQEMGDAMARASIATQMAERTVSRVASASASPEAVDRESEKSGRNALFAAIRARGSHARAGLKHIPSSTAAPIPQKEHADDVKENVGGIHGALEQAMAARRRQLAMILTTTAQPTRAMGRNDSGWSYAGSNFSAASSSKRRNGRSKSRSPGGSGSRFSNPNHTMTRPNMMRDFGDLL